MSNLSYEEASQLQAEALLIAQKNNLQLSIAVTDSHGELICFSRMNGVSLQTAPLARAKAYTAARMRKSTLLLGAWAEEKNKDIGNWVDPKITGLGGGLPIKKDNGVVGGMGVSGLSPAEDEDIVRQCLIALNLYVE